MRTCHADLFECRRPLAWHPLRIIWMQAAQKDLPDLDEDIAAGRFTALKSWLNEKIHKSGSLYPRQGPLYWHGSLCPARVEPGMHAMLYNRCV